MSVPLIINGTTYNYPQEFDTHWGPTLTAWSTAVTNGMLQKAGGSFPLTADVDFGTSFGIHTKYIISTATNRALSGFLRLARPETIGWRNQANSADLLLAVNSSNQLLFNGTPIAATTSLTNGHIFVGDVTNVPADVAMSGDITITNAGVTSIGAGHVTNAMIQSAAAIAINKLAALTASQIVVTDSSGFLTTIGAPTITELGYVSGVTSPIQTQINSISGGVAPVGTGADFYGTVPPTGWLICDGSAISRSTYSNLFSVIGTLWGVGDGSTTFNIPGMARKASIGSGGAGTGTIGNAVGNTGGEETHTLTTPEIPSHTHGVTDPGHSHTVGGYSNLAGGSTFFVRADTGGSPILHSPIAPSVGSNTTGISIGSTGGDGAHNNIQPSAVVLKIIKY